MTQIIVNLPWVNSTRESISGTRSRMEADSADAVSLDSAPDVDSGSTDFMNKWDERRGELAEYLKGVDDLFKAIYDAFSMTDKQLAEATQGD